MWKAADRLYCLTQDLPGISHTRQAAQVLAAGARLLQVRSKRLTDDELMREASEIVRLASAYGARVVVNDRVAVALDCGAHGVHLGQHDMPSAEARRILGAQALIGGTANTPDDVERLAKAGVDYIGLGPYRFTATKEGLSPTLGLDGVTSVLTAIRKAGIGLPVYAIGGIGISDIPGLLRAGVFGVAMSSAIQAASDPSGAVREALSALALAETYVT